MVQKAIRFVSLEKAFKLREYERSSYKYAFDWGFKKNFKLVENKAFCPFEINVQQSYLQKEEFNLELTIQIFLRKRVFTLCHSSN